MTDDRTRSIPTNSVPRFPSRVGGAQRKPPNPVEAPYQSHIPPVKRQTIMPTAAAQPTVTPTQSPIPTPEVAPTQRIDLSEYPVIPVEDRPGLPAASAPQTLPLPSTVYADYELEPLVDGMPNSPVRTPVAAASGEAIAVGKRRQNSDGDRKKKEESASRWKKGLRTTWETFLVILIAVVMSVLVKAFLIQAFEIPSGSMENTLQVNDRIIVSRLTPKVWDIKRGDIVVFYDSQNWLKRPPAPEHTGVKKVLVNLGVIPDNSRNHLVKRVIGIPGDHIVCDGKGKLVINGKPVDESHFIKPGSVPSVIAFDITVPPGRLWVMGDNRGNSEDSRFHQDTPGGGFVPISDVNGKAILRMWPLSRISLIESVHAYDQIPNNNAK